MQCFNFFTEIFYHTKNLVFLATVCLFTRYHRSNFNFFLSANVSQIMNKFWPFSCFMFSPGGFYLNQTSKFPHVLQDKNFKKNHSKVPNNRSQSIDRSSFFRNAFLPRSFAKIEVSVPASFLFCSEERRSFFRSFSVPFSDRLL